MKAPVAAGAVLGFLLLGVLVYAGGRSLEQPAVTIDMNDLPAEIPTGVDEPVDAGDQASTEASDLDNTGESTASSGLERIAPRGPLSELSLALPPKPPAPGEWKSTILHRAVAPAAGLIEAMDYRVSLAGIDPVLADESCDFDGRQWDCGVYARTAFRAVLRGRSPTCVVPPEPDNETIAADCRIGNHNLAAWLVSNGWARAASGGPYEDAGKKAEAGKVGIFGPPPSKGGLPDTAGSLPPFDTTARDTPSIEILVPDNTGEPTGGSSFQTLTPTVDQPAPVQ